MASYPNTSRALFSTGIERSTLPLFGAALAIALAVFLALGYATERSYEDEELQIISAQQHTMVVFLRKAIDHRLHSIAKQLSLVAERNVPEVVFAANTPEAKSRRLSEIFADISAVFPEISAHGYRQEDGFSLMRVTDQSINRYAVEEAVSQWLQEAPPDNARWVHIPDMVVSESLRLLGVVATPTLLDGTHAVLVVALDFDALVARFKHSMRQVFPSEMLIFDDSGIILLDERNGDIGGAAFSDAPEQDNAMQAMLRAMLVTPSASHICQIDDSARTPYVCRLMSWDSLTIANRTIVFAMTSSEKNISSHRNTAIKRRGVIAGFFALALAAIVGMFLHSWSQRKLALHALLLQTQQEASPDGILTMGKGNLPVSWNSRLLDLLSIGGNDSAITPEIVFKALEQSFSTVPGFLEAVSRVSVFPPSELEGQELPMANGRIVEVHSRGFHEHGDNESGRIWFLRDITEHALSRDSLRKTSEQLQSIVDNVPSMVYLRDIKGRYILANKRYHALFGWQDGFANGKPAIDLLPPDIAKRILEADRTIIETGNPLEYEEYVNTEHGMRALLTRETPILGKNGRVDAICGISTDITARKHIEDRLRTTVDEFETIFDNSLVGVLLQRSGGKIVRVNSRLGEIFGYEPKELIGRSSRILYINQEQFESFGQTFFAQLSKGALFNVEYEFLRSDGEHIWCQLSGKALDPANLDRGVIWIIDDITERKHLESLRDDVEQVMRHDLKSPLSTVIYVPQLLDPDDNLTAEQRELLDELKKAGHRMLEMINRSLDMLKMERGTYILKPEELDAIELVRIVARDLRSLSESKRLGLDLRTELGPVGEEERFVIYGERLLCYSMLANLIKNAMEAVPTGSTITITFSQSEERSIAIHNPGAVPEELQGRFFDKYASAGKSGGTGLGTYSARLMAEAHGGCLTLDSTQENGTTVIIHMPESPGSPTVSC